MTLYKSVETWAAETPAHNGRETKAGTRPLRNKMTLSAPFPIYRLQDFNFISNVGLGA